MDIPKPYAVVFAGLPRQGPGSEASTLEALRRLPALPDSPGIVDIGCGTGDQTLVLARELQTRVTAIDLHQPYLDELAAKAEARGLGDLIETRKADMGALDFPPESLDLIWAEGSIFILGFEKGLRNWRKFLKPGGLVAVSDAVWFRDSPPQEVLHFWKEECGGIGTISSSVEAAERQGYEVFDKFPLPASNWMDEYYIPLEKRLKELKPTAEGDVVHLIAMVEHEIDIFRRFSEYYGYVFFLMRKRPS